MNEKFEPGLVSVIIPVYNAGKIISQTIDSVLAQTYKKIEIVVVDDYSLDNSREVIEKYQAEHPEITLFCLGENSGAGATRNKALELAKGQYVAFLDADDLWHPEKLEKQIKLLKETGGAFSYTAIQMTDENGKVLKPKRNVRETIDYSFLLRNTMIATSTVVIDRFGVGDFRMPLLRGGQDYATWLKLLRECSVAYGIDEVLVDYRIGNKNSLSAKKCRSIIQVWEIQTKDEGIKPAAAAFNVFCFCVNAAKKYLF